MKSLVNYINESKKSIAAFYAEEDENGKTGNEGEVKSYDLGGRHISNWEAEAKEEGMTLKQYLKTWWNETGYEGRSFIWQKLGNGYGFHGTTVLKIGNVVFKEIYGQLMADESAPKK